MFTLTQKSVFSGIKTGKTILFLVLFILLNNLAFAQKPIDSLNFSTDGSINTAIVYNDNLYFGGVFRYTGQKTGTMAVFHNGSSVPDYKMPVFGRINPANLGEYNSVLTVVSDNKGGWFAGGKFRTINGRKHIYLAHILPDKQIDESFILPFTGYATNGQVTSLKKDDRYLYVGGLFAFTYNGNDYKNIFRIDLSTMKIDETWNPDLPESEIINQIELYDQKVFLSGWIGKADTVKQGAMVALDKVTAKPIYLPTSVSYPTLHLLGDTLLLANISMSPYVLKNIDPNAVNGFGYIVNGASLFDENDDMPLKPSFNGIYYALISDGNGGWYAAGKPDNDSPGIYHFDKNMNELFRQTDIHEFSNSTRLLLLGNNLYVCTSLSYTKGNIYKLNASTGERDNSFQPDPNGRVWSMVAKGDTLFVAGNFSEIDGENHIGIAAINSNTGAAYNWNAQINDTAGFFWGLGKHRVSDLLIVNDTLYAAGIFLTESEDPQTNITSLVRYDLATGEPDTSFHLSRETNTLPLFHSLAYHNGKLYVAGIFNLTQQTDTIRNVGVINPKTREITNLNTNIRFEPLPEQLFNAQGLPMVKENNGRLYFSGMITYQKAPKERIRFYFASIDEATMTLTDWDPAPSSSVYAMAFNPDRVLLSGLFYFVKYNSFDLTAFNLSAKQFINKFPFVILPHGARFASTDQYIFIGGGFEEYGDSVVHGIVRLKRKDFSITHFNHQIGENKNPFFVEDMVIGKEGLYVTGRYNSFLTTATGAFSSVAGQPRQNICLLNPETGALKSWNPPPYNAGTCHVFVSDSDVVLSGDFTMMPAYERTHLARIDLKTGKLSSWNPVIGERYATINALLPSGDTLYIGGHEITTVNGKPAGNICAVSIQTGSLIEGFHSPQLDGDVFSLYKTGNTLYATGGFKNVQSVSHRYVARFRANSGEPDTWDPKLTESWSTNVNAVLVADTFVYLAGRSLSVPENTEKGILLKTGEKSGTSYKLFPGDNYSAIGSMTKNDRGDIAVGMKSGGEMNADFLLLDKKKDTLLPVSGQPGFEYAITKIKATGKYFLVAGNHIEEFDSYTEKPGMFIYDPEEDTIISVFSTPVIEGEIKTFANTDKTLVFAGNFGGMNVNVHNSDIAFMQMPPLQLQPGVTSWSPKTANTADPFSISVYGSGFTQNSKVTLLTENQTQQPDSMTISPQKITAYFNGTHFTAGEWDLKVEIASGNTPVFSKAITIEEAEKTKIWIDWSIPDNVKANKPTTGYIRFGNDGDKGAYGVFIYLGIAPEQVLELPDYVRHPDLDLDVDWDTIPRFIDVDYFLGEPYQGKVCVLFVPYLPAHYDFNMKVKLTTNGTESTVSEIQYAISNPLYDSYEELTSTEKSTQNLLYDVFRCAYDVVGIVADLTPGVGCIKSIFDNTVIAGADKYMNDESVGVSDVTTSLGMIALGCVPGGAELGKAVKISKGMVEAGMDYSGVFSSCKKVADDADKNSQKINALFSHDPNAKYGPSGEATSPYVHTHQPYQYLITYENDSAATAPAERVVITDTLDQTVFDINTFKPIGFGFGDTTYFYNTNDGDTINIDLRPEKDIIVRVFYQLSPEGILIWTFETLDPNTYQAPDDVNAGFLPPNKKAPEGEGNVIYSVEPLPGLPDGTSINNTAHIVFDWNEAIPTENWHNITDNNMPESAVDALPAVSLNKDFTVNWSGHDENSGVYAYTIFVAEDDSAYYPWLPLTTQTTAVFSGEAGHTYKFYSIAIDSAGNQEPAPATYDAITQVSGTGIDNFGTNGEITFHVYPNPAKDQATISCFLPENGNIRIDLLNSCGKFVKNVFDGIQPQGKNMLRINLTTLPNGYYFVRIRTKQGIQTRKLIIQ